MKKFKLSILQRFNDMEIQKGLNHRDFDVTKEEYFHIIRELDREGLIKNVFYADNEPYDLTGVYVTNEGKDFLEENKPINKVKKFISSVVGILK